MACFDCSLSVVFRCVPDPRALVKHIDERANITSVFLKILNSDGIFRKVLSDVYISWKEMLALCGIALGKTFSTERGNIRCRTMEDPTSAFVICMI